MSILAGIFLLFVPLGMKFLGGTRKESVPAGSQSRKPDAMPVPCPEPVDPCPYPAFPRSGWLDPAAGGFFVPHGWSYDEGLKRANSGVTKFIISGDMNGTMTYAHFEKSGGNWTTRIDDYLP